MMSTISAEQNYNFHKIDIPPRKLLYRPSAATDENLNSAVFSKFLPHNDGDDSDDPYSSYHFRMYEFKVRRCSRSRSHDWTDCPFAHPGEKARRRDPRRHRYSGTVCSEFRKDGRCGDGDNCQFSHGVFECWLHPSRYRTEACKDRKNCKRKICFFAHSTRQLRLVPEVDNIPSPPSAAERKCRCYVYCHSPVAASPTSTLIGQMYNNLSPPISPVCSPEFSTYGGGCFSSAESCAALSELMEAMSMNESSPAAGGSLPWLDVDFHVEEQPQFVMSPSTPAAAAGLRRGGSEMFSGDSKVLMDERRYKYNNNEGNSGGPDLGWVNDLLT